MRYENVYKRGQIWKDMNGEYHKVVLVERLKPRQGPSEVYVTFESVDTGRGSIETCDRLDGWEMMSS